jgi:Raf kinase inhibitor-like YbhB/YbcL family protein
VNQPDREVPAGLPRVEFFHWLAIDLPPDLTGIDEGEFCAGVVPRGQQAVTGPHGCRQGINDFTGWFSGDAEMSGSYYGYDGPAPPWNDSIIHHYVFSLFALDVAHLAVGDGFTGAEARAAMEGHILGSASVTGTYTQNPRLR